MFQSLHGASCYSTDRSRQLVKMRLNFFFLSSYNWFMLRIRASFFVFIIMVILCDF